MGCRMAPKASRADARHDRHHDQVHVLPHVVLVAAGLVVRQLERHQVALGREPQPVEELDAEDAARLGGDGPEFAFFRISAKAEQTRGKSPLRIFLHLFRIHFAFVSHFTL